MLDFITAFFGGISFIYTRFGVTYDAATRSVRIESDRPYTDEVTDQADTQTTPGALSRNADGSINVPQDGSLYTP